MSAGDLPCLATMAFQDVLGLSVLIRAFRLVRVPCLALTTTASANFSARLGPPSLSLPSFSD